MSRRLLFTCLFFLTLAGLVTYRLAGQTLDHYSYLPLVASRAGPGVDRPIIDYFRANVDIADPGDTIQLQWATTNAVTVTLQYVTPGGQLGQWWDVEPEGVFDYEIPTTARNNVNFILFASNQHGWTSAGLYIPLTCPDTWFFAPAPNECPSGLAVVSAGAEQHFEHGTMIWVEAQNVIYVLFDDGMSYKWYVYLNEWQEGDPEDDPTIVPPPGFYQPVRGFGLVWREQQGVRQRLGWAVDTEAGYETAVQSTSRSKYNDTYIRALDGNVWRLLPEFSGWEKIVTE